MKGIPLGAALALTLGLGLSSQAAAAWPEKPITIVVGYAAGGTTDILARALGEQLGKLLGQSIIVENKPGAAGNIAAASVENAPADGYTLFMATVSSHGINPALYQKNLGYRPQQGFAPVGMVASIPLLLVTNPKLPVASVDDLVDLARAKPGDLNYSSSGNGSPVHLAGAMFAKASGVNIIHVPYRGGGLANASVMSGETQFTFATMPAAIPQVKAGTLKAIAVTTAERSRLLPDTPTIGENPGFKGYEINTWNALMAPAGTPAAAVDRLNGALAEALKNPALRERFEREGATTDYMDPRRTGEFIQQQLAHWQAVVERVEIRIQ